MIFNVLTPQDNEPALDIDIYIRDLKEVIHERLLCTNSDGFDEHQSGDDLGLHPPSLTSFVAVFNTVAEYNAFSKVPDGLYFVRENNTLYSATQPLTTDNHQELAERGGVDAHDFYHIGDDSREHTVNIEFSGAINIIEGTPTSEGSEPLRDSHVALAWATAHGNNSFLAAWIQPTVLEGVPTHVHNLTSGKRYIANTITLSSPTTTRMEGLYVNSFSLMPAIRFRNFAGMSPSGGSDIWVGEGNFNGRSDLNIANWDIPASSARRLILREV